MYFEDFINDNVLILTNSVYSEGMTEYLYDRFDNLVVYEDMSFEEVLGKLNSAAIHRNVKLNSILNGVDGDPRILVNMNSLYSMDPSVDRHVHHKMLSGRLGKLISDDIVKCIVTCHTYTSVSNGTPTSNLIGGSSLLYTFPYAISVGETVEVIKNRYDETEGVLIDNTQKLFRNIKLNKLISDESSK
jgi:hypothetical protein